MSKRPPISKKKRETTSESETPGASTPAPSTKRIMATFYLSPAAVEKLDRVWLARRMRDRKAQKSQIIEDLIVRTLKEEPLPG